MAQSGAQGREYQGVPIPPAGTYELDAVHTVVGFVARHMLSKVRGQFTLSGEFLGWGPNMQGEPMLAASAKTTIDREEWDMTWNMAVETGGFLVGKKVDLEIEVEAHRVG